MTDGKKKNVKERKGKVFNEKEEKVKGILFDTSGEERIQLKGGDRKKR